MGFFDTPPRARPFNALLVRQAAQEIAEAAGQIVQAFDPWEYPSIRSDEKGLMLARHKLHEAATNLRDAAEMLDRAAPQEQA